MKSQLSLCAVAIGLFCISESFGAGFIGSFTEPLPYQPSSEHCDRTLSSQTSNRMELSCIAKEGGYSEYRYYKPSDKDSKLYFLFTNRKDLKEKVVSLIPEASRPASLQGWYLALISYGGDATFNSWILLKFSKAPFGPPEPNAITDYQAWLRYSSSQEAYKDGGALVEIPTQKPVAQIINQAGQSTAWKGPFGGVSIAVTRPRMSLVLPAGFVTSLYDKADKIYPALKQN